MSDGVLKGIAGVCVGLYCLAQLASVLLPHGWIGALMLLGLVALWRGPAQ